ncbi:MAG: PaaI family thioesterase [Bacteroidota bacterium]
MLEPDLSGEPAWMPIIPPSLLTQENSFISGDPTGNRLRLRYYYDEASTQVIARTWFGPGAEGPPRHAHGGSVAAVLDEAMGMAALYAGHTVVAANISINYLKMVPLETVASAIAQVTRVAGKKIYTEARLVGTNGTVLSRGEGLFITIPFNKIATLAEPE